MTQLQASPQRSRFPKRCGVSLIETTLAVTLAMVMLGLAVYTMHLLMHSERQLKKADWQAESLLRLSTLYRRDAHSALKVELQESNDGDVITFMQPAKRNVVYKTAGGRIVRTTEFSGKVQHRDAFVVPNESLAQFQYDRNSKVTTIRIRNQPSARGSSSEEPVAITPEFGPDRVVRIEAIVGRDHRFMPEPL
jgi:hypothetical protein